MITEFLGYILTAVLITVLLVFVILIIAATNYKIMNVEAPDDDSEEEYINDKDCDD